MDEGGEEENLSPSRTDCDREGRDGDSEGDLKVEANEDEMEDLVCDIAIKNENDYKTKSESAETSLEENDMMDDQEGHGSNNEDIIIGTEYFGNDIGLRAIDFTDDELKNETYTMESAETARKPPIINVPGNDSKKIAARKIIKNMSIVPYKKGTLSTNSAITKPANLPDCKVRRSYVCGYCNMKTVNPREYLYHLKDDHGEIIRIYECSYCVYASKTHQKLVRHTDMVHKIKLKPESEKKPKPKTKSPKSATATAFGAALSRSPRESKSPRRFDEYDFSDNFLDVEEYYIPSSDSATDKQIYHCNQCDYSVASRKELGKHKAKCHLKRKYYRCTKCTYATNIKARYTKHLKYHELPIIKCDWCDFRTPYKWNLDRHIKNHTEDSGEHKCHICNFSASIRQSLSAHVLNHHLTPEQIASRERRRTLGIYESEDDIVGDEEMEMLRLEREEDLDALEVPSPTDTMTPDQSFTVSNIDMGSQDDNDSLINDCDDRENGEPKRKKPKIKITFKKMKVGNTLSQSDSSERHNLDQDFIHPDDVVHKNGNVYIKTEKCSLCSFRAPFQCEIVKHKKRVHGIHSLKETPGVKKLKKQKSFEKLENFSGMLSAEKINDISKFRDEDNFDEKLSDTSNGDEEKMDDYSNEEDSSANQSPQKDNDDFKLDDDSSSRDNYLKKKSTTSFFDKLQEKLSLSNVQNLVCQFCGHESKCLSESVRHQKLHLSAKNIFATASLSTRCQFCRHRCKTTDDLMSHLKSCPEARKNQIGDDFKNAEDVNSQSGKSSEGKSSCRANSVDSDETKHPMENKVFVWNNMSNEENESGQAENELSCEDVSRSASEFDNVDSDDQMNDFVSALKSATTKVYRCPQCSFRSTTASRFHVHMVGHYNKKPYSCSICPYRSNWRWDITKHIKLKIPRDENHKKADICLSDETLIEKNYEKYDKYVTEVSREEIHHSEGGFSMSRKGLPKTSPTETDSNGTDSAKSSPCPTPILNGSMVTRIPAPPKLTRAPNRQSSIGPIQFGPVIPGAQAMSEKVSQRPPPLLAMGNLAQQQPPSGTSISDQPSSVDMPANSTDDKIEDDPLNTSSNYQIITQQGAMNTSLETLQLLASGSTNLARLKKQQQKTGIGNDPELDAAVTNQMRLLLWLNCLVGGGGTEQKDGDAASKVASVTAVNPPGAAGGTSGGVVNIMRLVLDHEGNPEWKCATCDFRDNEQDTVAQHVRLAHGKKGPVSLVHAVHRCSLCGFAAGTKRHVQVHIESDHRGQGGIISRSEGQNIDAGENGEDNARSFECRLCPFNCKKRMELKSHLSHHTPRVDYIFKCMFCPFYVATKNELFAHLSVHGMDIPTTNRDSPSNGAEPIQTSLNSESTDDNSARQFICDLCPFETRSRAKLMHHRQFHRPRNLPFSCPHCSYNVTRRHLLAQHLRIHGVSPTDGMEGDGTADKPLLSKIFMEDGRLARKSPSPSLTITPITSSANMTNGTSSTSNIDPDCLPNLSNELTKNLPDIPLVWVSRDGRFFKMFKCRHCPHVNLRKTNIQEHEKMHRSEGLVPGAGHACQFCSYTCINAGVMSAHVKVHSGSMGKCHALVDPALANEEQLRMLAGSSINKSLSDKAVKKSDEKLLYYCQHCPARFFFEKEVHIHSRSHNVNSKFTHHCSKCDFGGREESQVLAHAKVHTPEYQERTRTLMSMHPSAPAFPPVSRLSVPGDVTKPTFGVPLEDSDVNRNAKGPQLNGISRPWLISSSQNNSQISDSSSMPQPPPTSRFKCDQCPSTFSKLITLQYHQSLHSADNPFRCTRCSYAAKTQDGLQQHVALHEQADLEKNTSNSVMSSAASSPAPSPSPINSPQKILENTFGSFGGNKIKNSSDQPPIKLKFIGLKGSNNSTSKSAKKQQFKYYIEEQVPLSGVELLKRKHQIEREMPKDAYLTKKETNKSRSSRPEDRSGNPSLHYPLHIDKSSGRSREKRYKCLKCPSAFEKLDQFNVHINLHGSNYKYRCRICDYSVKFYANFMMHMKRHKYHEKVNAQRKGLPGPEDDDIMFEPLIGENPAAEERIREREPDEALQDKENQFDFDANPEMTTAEKQQIILQNKKADSFLPKDDDKDKRIFYCQFCPYANLRRDAVDSHSLRHQANSGKGVYQCKFCDYCASGPNFIREHTKVHFRPFKYVIPEGFMKHDKLEIWSIKSVEVDDSDNTPKKSLSFIHDEGIFGPKVHEVVGIKLKEYEKMKDLSDFGALETVDDSQVENGILVDYRSGDVLEAPNSFILPMRPSRGSRSTAPSGGTSKESSRSSKSSYSKSKRARKHAKMKSDRNLINVNDSSNDANVDFHDSTVTVDENIDYNGHAISSEACGEDPLDISNHSDNLVDNYNDETAVDDEMEELLENGEGTIETGAEETIKNGSEEIIENGGEETMENGGEETMKNGGETMENGGEETMENGAEGTMENVDEETFENCTEESTENGGEEVIENDDQDYEMADCTYDNNETKTNSMECVPAV